MSRVSRFILAFSDSIVVGISIPVPGGWASGGVGMMGCWGSGGAPVTNWSSWAMWWAALGFGGMVVFFPLWRVVFEVAMMVSK